MARILESYEFPDPYGDRPQNSGKYPYAEWFDGQVRELVHGEDFGVSARSMRTGLSHKAKVMREKGQLRPGRLYGDVRLNANKPDTLVIQYVVHDPATFSPAEQSEELNTRDVDEAE